MKYEREIRGQNFYALDTNLQRILARRDPRALAKWDQALSLFGEFVGSDVDEEAEYTDRFARPVLEAYSRDGALVNDIRYNPEWQRVATEVYRRGIVGLNYVAHPAPFTVTFAMGYLLSQADLSLHCPVTMTGAVAYVIDRFAPSSLRATYLPQLVRMDGEALSGGTWATELHGGSDVGATTTVARRDGDRFRLNGLKWFVSNPDGGLALATARPEGAPEGSLGLGLYLVPTRLEDGSRNAMHIRRLKDKLGSCGVATAEIDLTDTLALEVAPPPVGFKLMMEALEFSRIHNAMSAIGLQRRAFLEAAGFLFHRQAFGATVTDYPMVQDELIKMLVRLESGCALAFESAAAFDTARLSDPSDDAGARPWMRLVTALAKYQTAEDANIVCRAAIEIMGGNAYTTDHVTPRLLRDAQVLTVWEGPANIQALEVLRMLGKRYPGFEAFADRLKGIVGTAPAGLVDLAQGVDGAFAHCREAVSYVRSEAGESHKHARKLMALLADTLAGALLLEEASAAYAEGDGRKALIARLFIEDRIAPPANRGIGPGHDWANRQFEALVGYEPIATGVRPAQAVG